MIEEKRKRAVIFSAVYIEADMRNYLHGGDFIVACDAGYRNALRLGVAIDLLIGDFDSAPQPNGGDTETIVLPHIKDDTDTHYAAKWLLTHGYNEIVMLGAVGGARVEHTFANIATALFLAKSGVDVCMADEKSEMHILAPGKITSIAHCDWKYLSLFPLEGALTGIAMSGVFYPLANAQLQADEPLGVSNEFVEETAVISCKSGYGLLVLSHTDA